VTDAESAGQFPYPFDAFLAALGHDVGRAELLPHRGPVGVPAHEDDLFGAEHLRRPEHGAQADGPVADDRDG
jgi:hypothetical protein